nr:bis(5'-nucleosyl)-tetraphosphatase (symmetrical) YqeK [Blautia sp. An46]
MKMKYNFAEYEKKLKKYLDKDRYRHTLGVMYTAAALAMAHEYDMEQAQMAGLLHDCAKCIPNKKKLKICRKQNIRISSVEQANPFLLHAKLGAYIAEKKYQVEDEEILSAIRWHTTGKEAMSDLEKIVYIADYIEPGRNKAPRLPWIRRVAFEDLDEGMYYILKDSLSYLGKGSKVLDPMTQKAFDYYETLHLERKQRKEKNGK